MKNGRLIIIVISVLLIILISIIVINDNIEFTNEEIMWMKEHPVIYIAPDPTFGPIEFFDDSGKFKGVAADYIQWIEDKTPLNFEVIKYDTWSEVLLAIQNDEVDMLSAVTPTERRDSYLKFSETYFTIPNVILARNEYKGKVDLSNLSNHKVVVIDDYATEDYISLNYPNIDLVPVKSTEEGLALVSLGTYNYMVISLAQASYYLPESGITNLKVCGEIPFDNELAFGVRESYEPLIYILNKALKEMPKELEDSIYMNWITVEFNNGISKEVVLTLIIIFLVILVIIIAILFFNHVLKQTVAQKTQALNNELNERKKIENDLAELNEHLEDEVSKRTIELQVAFNDLKEVQNNLVASDKMASLSKMLINISHNLNTPIGTSITLNSFEESLIKKIDLVNVDETLSCNISQLKNSNKMIAVELEDARIFLNEMKKLSNIKIESTTYKVNIYKYLCNLEANFKRPFSDNNVEMIINCGKNIELLISKANLDNIFINLINNSIEFGFEHKESGIISVETIYYEDTIKFIYKDNGIGIKEDISKNIFDPLFTTNMGKTSGWGLSILYNTVKFALNGNIDFKSKLNEGVEFIITLDINKERII